MHIICNNEANEGGVQVWSCVYPDSSYCFMLKPNFRSICRQIKVASLFTDYRIQSNANNEITMELTSEALLGALRSAMPTAGSAFDVEEIIMKLAKKNDQALLSFEILGLSRVGHKIRVAQDVKIEVMKPADVAKLAEPLCPEPDVRASLSM